MCKFEVIDPETGRYPDMDDVVLEEWAHGLMHCDLDGFAMTESGGLLLLDDCGNYAFCPYRRFDVRIKSKSRG